MQAPCQRVLLSCTRLAARAPQSSHRRPLPTLLGFFHHSTSTSSRALATQRSQPSIPRSFHSSTARRLTRIESPTKDAQDAAQEAEDLLNLAQSLSRTPMNGNTEMRCTIYRPEEPPEATTTAPMSKHDISREFSLSPRDLRSVDLKSDGSPHMLVRKHTILIHMFSLRLIIQSDRVALLHIDQGDAESRDHLTPESTEAAAAAAQAPEMAHEPAMTVAATIFETKMRATGGKLPHSNSTTTNGNGRSAVDLPYELRVVEAALASVTSAIEAEYLLARQHAGRVLQQLDAQVLDKDEALIFTEMRELLGLVRKLAAIEHRASSVRTALQEVMDDNDDMAEMYLSDTKAGKPHESGDHQEVEYMLEAYFKSCDGVAQGAAGVMANIQRTDETIQSILNVRRNQIMVLDTKIEITMLGFAAATLVAGYLGMNVINYMEESKYAFALLVVGSMAGSGWIWWRGLRRLQSIQKGRHRSY